MAPRDAGRRVERCWNVGDFPRLGADADQLLVGAVELLVGVREHGALGRHHLVDAEVLTDVDDPRAEAGGGAGLVADEVRVEVGVGQVVRLHLLHADLGRVVLVEGDERLQELVDVPHGLLGGVPAEVLGDLAPGGGEDHAGGGHVHHLRGGAAEGLELAEGLLVEGVESGLGLGNDGLGRLEVLLALRLEGGHLGGDGGARLLVVLAGGDRLVDDRLLLPDGHD